MSQVIGGILPLAVGVAISPIPIIAAILMLLSPKARATSVGFMIGWLAGIVVAVLVFIALSSVIAQSDDGSSTTAGVITIILGGLLVLLAVRPAHPRHPGSARSAEGAPRRAQDPRAA